jgi:hypothetical protein
MFFVNFGAVDANNNDWKGGLANVHILRWIASACDRSRLDMRSWWAGLVPAKSLEGAENYGFAYKEEILTAIDAKAKQYIESFQTRLRTYIDDNKGKGPNCIAAELLLSETDVMLKKLAVRQDKS